MQRWVEQKEQHRQGQEGWRPWAQVSCRHEVGQGERQGVGDGSGHPRESLDEDEEEGRRRRGRRKEKRRRKAAILHLSCNHNDKVLLLPCLYPHFILAPGTADISDSV